MESRAPLRRITIAMATIGFAFSASCKPLPSAFKCSLDIQCTTSKGAGICEIPTGFCSTPDATCPSGKKYVDADSLSGTCVPVAAATCPAGAILCDGFEDGTLAKWTQTTSTGGALVVQQQTKHSGSYALSITQSAQSGNLADGIADPAIQAPTTGVITMRAWLDDGIAANSFYGGQMGLYNSNDLAHYINAVVDSNGDYAVSEAGGTTSTDHAGSAATTPVSTWYCMEIDYTYPTSGTPHVKLYVNDAVVVDTDTIDTMSAFDVIQVGLFRVPATGGSRFVDDVVISDQHIGCQ